MLALGCGGDRQPSTVGMEGDAWGTPGRHSAERTWTLPQSGVVCETESRVKGLGKVWRP